MVEIKLDFRLFDPQAELSALRDSIATLEEQLAAITATRSAQANKNIAALTGQEYEDGEAQLIRQELEYEVEYTLPRVYRGALLLLIWSAYESGVQDVISFLVERKKPALDVSDMSGRTVLDKAKKYFPGVLDFALFSDGTAQSRIGELEKVRNAIAHATGRLNDLRQSTRDAVEAMVQSGQLEEGLGWLILPKSYLSSAMDLVDQELSGLIKRALAWDDGRE